MPKTTDQSFWQSPAFSLKGRTDFPNYISSPGPVYKVDQTTRHGQFTNTKVKIGLILVKSVCTYLSEKQIISIYIHENENIIISNNPVADDYGQSPGPAAYLPCFPNLKRAPTPKLLLPVTTQTDAERNDGPSPNTYSLRGEHRSSIKSRRKGYTM